ncbi:hypothetical protein A2276_02310 [candidate division WOR-1 bacterium RIFOXYA12_FULL_43_27]|uniref:DUF7670 domain-containing protein n=1 Tax=candidate division WOR-1 bacterium RIFOXYC2_FULL_46_14 TaxID=1802587 RepID=A0A1F4U7W5_UNCSA|nr:MAG: hypothetical protein A2276_02310 [candidate division WOR-1 bacterium RIFOXYA12_FULL_43_27]OGC19455.1 MAG: hypothetical protein A2292_02020 [candidate division WOR-1 bacterium RIFOXYB2_FULL_46_45]OGC30444.1 MAG: hypothetical protein A2232_02020 [candidate division WOR-1 bacterium RIFOXYA2_FULL_46_56]OGC41044.1 MAG: hypothetical protein A2438_02020 [candidate division WOR-1 bacterium RIFOXYC2_FULL_46_14]
MAIRRISIAFLAGWGLFIFFSHGFSAISIFEWIFWLVLLAITFTAWKLEFLGGSLFLFLGLFYLLIGIGKAPLFVFLVVPLPLLILGSLFIRDAVRKKK